MDLIGIIDGGSTKTDFIFSNLKGEELYRTQTIGFNPLLISVEDILINLKGNEDLVKIGKHVKAVYYYGAGAQTERLQNLIKSVLGKLFTKATIQVEGDMLAAAYAAYKGRPTLVGILGTGCNTCYFDGKAIQKPNPSLGYVIGDEGSGNHIGKNLLRSYFAGKFPEEIKTEFENKYNLMVDDLLETIYQKPSANAYLASFASFAVENKRHPFIENLVADCFQEFFEYQVYPYHRFDYEEINFIGSIAHHFREILSAVSKNNNLMIGQVVQKPIDKLVAYHFKYLI
ncbi:ATPase [Flavobacteriaceae bacterium Ap0902]|nr:ATPase [Flavobacteriaceae bacterium Ap0902]